MDIFFPGQIIPKEILKDDALRANNAYIDAAGNSFYNHLLMGLAENGCTVSAVSRTDGAAIKKYGKTGEFSGVSYMFKPYRKNLLLRSLSMFFGTFFSVLAWQRKSKGEKILLLNCLRIANCMAAVAAAKLLGIKICAVVTDVPKHRVHANKRKLLFRITDKLGDMLLDAYDYFFFLSADMNPIVNRKQRPYIVSESIVDENLFAGIEEEKYETFTMMYAGSLMRKYNIMELVEAVSALEEDVRLLIYGAGELEEELREISVKNPKILFRGKAPQDEILREEKRVHLLINPRSTKEEYTKLSFPSKNCEYMLSGTPVLFTRLASMPEDYYAYINLIEDESSEGIKNAILGVLAQTQADLEKKAERASAFIRQNKEKKIVAERALGLFGHNADGKQQENS